jgi:glyoxylase-like metal-dependent hydrolase (beta-lactamase superfamily II)
MSLRDFAIEPVVSAPFDQVAYVVWKRGQPAGVVVDPGFDTNAIEAVLRREGLALAAIRNTHGHADHIAGNGAIKSAHPDAPLVIGRNEAHLLSDPKANLSGFFGVPLKSPPADRFVDQGERLEIAGMVFEVREIPGHSPGSVVFVCEEADPPFVLGGDVLFAGSVGRTDLGGNASQLFAGIKAQLFNLPDETIVYPGHGPPTTIGEEKRTNPFVGENAGLHGIR